MDHPSNAPSPADGSGLFGDAATVQLLTSAVEGAYDAVLITDARLEYPGPEIVYVNDAFTRMTGYPADTIVGRTPRVLQGPGTDRETLDRLRGAVAGGEAFTGRTINYRADGTPYHVEWRITPLRDETGSIRYYVAIQRDVSQQESLLTDLALEADLDTLTGLYNRTAITSIVEHEVERALRHDLSLSVILLDLDDFKSFNDTRGQAAGDEFLQWFARQLDLRLRANDVLGRWGGDAFAIVLPHTGTGSATVVARSALELLDRHPAAPEAALGASLGISQLAATGNAREILSRAEDALGAARRNGGNRIEVIG